MVLKWCSGQLGGAWVVMKGAGRILNGNFGQGWAWKMESTGYLVAQIYSYWVKMGGWPILSFEGCK